MQIYSEGKANSGGEGLCNDSRGGRGVRRGIFTNGTRGGRGGVFTNSSKVRKEERFTNSSRGKGGEGGFINGLRGGRRLSNSSRQG